MDRIKSINGYEGNIHYGHNYNSNFSNTEQKQQMIQKQTLLLK